MLGIHPLFVDALGKATFARYPALMEAREIFVPNGAAIRNARSFLADANWATGQHEHTVRFHPKFCFMQPWAISALAAWALEHRAAGGAIQAENPDTAGLGYAWRMGLAEYLGIEAPATFQEHEEAGRFIALRTVKHRDELAELLSGFVTLLHVLDEAAEYVLYAMSEMVRNTLEHAFSRGAVVCAQRYAGRKTRREYVSLGIADTGRGVRASLSGKYVVNTSADAVLKAIEPGVSGVVGGMYGSSDNAGAGLFVTRRLSRETRGYFAIASGDAMFRSSIARKSPPDSELVLSIAPYGGTVVCVEVGLSKKFKYSKILREAWASLGKPQLELPADDLASKVVFT